MVAKSVLTSKELKTYYEWINKEPPPKLKEEKQQETKEQKKEITGV